MDSEHLDWLSRTVEVPLDPEQRICDPHHHFFRGEPFGPYLLDDLHADTGAGHRVVSTVYVEAGQTFRTDGPAHLQPVGETEFVVARAAESDRSGGARVLGIVSRTDLRAPLDVLDEALDSHEAAAGGRFRGIRQQLAWDADPTLASPASPGPGAMASVDLRRGLAHLGVRGHTFDAWLYHPQLPELAELARAVPGTTIVVNHLGAPMNVGSYADRDEVRRVWRAGIDAVAARPNVVMKLGGLGMARMGGGWRERAAPPTSEELAAHWAPEIETCIERFGADRCMFESNFPVDRESTSYTVLWNTFQRLAAGCSPADRDAVFHDTATRVYRLA